MTTRRVRDLKRGDRIQTLDGRGAIVSYCAPDDRGKVLPYRASAARVAVPAWHLIWSERGRERGSLIDPEDEVYLA